MAVPGRTTRDPHARGGRSAGTDQAPVLRIGMLGGFRVSLGARIIDDSAWRLRKSRNLLKLLALAPGHRLHREELLDTLWPDLDSRAAANNLHYALHVARGVLGVASPGGSPYVKLGRDEVALCPAQPVWIDVEAFEEAAAAARHGDDPAACEAALRLYTGDLLPEDRYEDWAQHRRERLREQYLALLVTLARLSEERGDPRRAIELLRRVVTEEPLHEEAHRALMGTYGRAGQRHEAMRQYRRLTEVLHEGLGTVPDGATLRLYEQLLAEPSQLPGSEIGAADSHQRADTAIPRHNLPLALTSFIGREREIERAESALSTNRLVTVAGSGGAGKTRLALRVAADLIPRFEDGVWLVELASITDSELVEQAAARALGVREQPGRPLTDSLVEYLRDSDQLIVLDNCEHLPDACAQLATTLLTTCRRVSILATSREPLGIPGEIIMPVRSLSVPDPDTAPDPRILLRYESIRLFLERARYRQPSFALTGENAAAVAEICRRLDGIPLAIELAAARVGVLTVGQIAARLDDALGLLAGGGRIVAPRHRTMRGLLDWSYGLLDERESALFACLSVFAGGWMLEAAQAVVPDQDVLDLLARLVDKSLVLAEERGDRVRYRMLEPVRQYARERLEQTGDADAVRRRHTRQFLTMAEQAERELTGPRQAEWLARLEEEQDNLRAALSWALGPQHPDAGPGGSPGARLAAALWPFWRAHGHLAEGRRWLEKALGPAGELPEHVRARLLLGAGLLAWQQSDFDRAKTLLDESVTLQRRTGDTTGIAEGLNYLGAVAHHEGEYARAIAFYEESLSLRREFGERHEVAASLNNLGLALFSQGRLTEAESLLEESLDLARRSGDRWSCAYALDSLGMVAAARGELERARGHFAASLGIVRDLDDRWCIVACLDGLAGVAGEQGDPLRAARIWGAAEALRDASGASISPAWQASYEAKVAAARAEADDTAWTAAWAEGRSMTLREAVEYALSPPLPAEAPTGHREPPTPTGVRSTELTRREREIAFLVAQGLTNRRIADRLVLSERTVDAHVARVLRKLGLPSRKKVAEWAETQRLPAES